MPRPLRRLPAMPTTLTYQEAEAGGVTFGRCHLASDSGVNPLSTHVVAEFRALMRTLDHDRPPHALVISAEGEPTLFHPGDSLATAPSGVDVLATPLYGPWAAMKETVDFARAVDATHGFPIHDGLLHDRGVALIYGRLEAMTGMAMHNLRDGRPWTVAG